MRAAAPIRVSTGKQVEGLSLGVQERRVRERAQREGWELELFREVGSGRRSDRQVLDEIERRLDEFDAVIIPRIDRLGRNPRRLRRFRDALEDHHVKLVCLEPDLDFDSFAGKVVWEVMILLAEQESAQLGARVSAVAGARARAGKQYGGPPPYGYASDPGNGLVPLPAEAENVRRMFTEAANGRSAVKIARGLNADGVRARKGGVWHGPDVSRILRNETYIGAVRLKGETYPGLHEPLIDREVWERVVAAREANRRGGGPWRQPSGPHLFTRGLLNCAHCGHTMSPRTDHGRETYICRGRLRHGRDFCPQTPIPRSVIDEAVFAYFREVGLDLEATKRQLAGAAAGRLVEAARLLEDAERDVSAAHARLARVDRDYADGLLEAPEWRTLRLPLATESEAALGRRALLQARVEDLTAASAVDDAEAAALERLAELHAAVAGEVTSQESIEAIRAALLRLFERFDVGRADIPPDPSLPPDYLAARAQAQVDLAPDQLRAGCWIVLPWARPESIESLGEEWRPALTKEALVVAPTMEQAGSRSFHSWAPILVSRRGSGLSRSPAG